MDVRLRGLRGSIGRNLTCCQEELLRNEKSVLYESVDHIFVLNPPGESPLTGLGSARIVGDKQKDKTVSGMWPSDHAGVVARIPLRDEAD